MSRKELKRLKVVELINKTQAYALAAIAGPETDGWIGRQVTLSAALAPNGAQTMAITAPAACPPAGQPEASQPGIACKEPAAE